MKHHRAEIIVVGFELLNGTTLDSNSHWLSRQLVDAGVTVFRKTTVGDHLKDIAGAFRESLSRNPEWIFSIGGLGPTYDDKTVQGLGIALGRRLIRNELAVRMLVDWYRKRADLLGTSYKRPTKSSLKMALMPIGATPLRNSAGSASGVMCNVTRTTVIVFPGVPREMRAIFLEDVKPILVERSGGHVRKEIWMAVKGVGESHLAYPLKIIAKIASPDVYVKTHPIGFSRGAPVLKVQLIAKDFKTGEKSDLKLKQASDAISKTVSKFHGRITRTWSIG